MCFARGCLAIGKYCPIVSIQNICTQQVKRETHLQVYPDLKCFSQLDRMSFLTLQLTFDNLLSHCVVELNLSCVGLEHAIKEVRFALGRGGGNFHNHTKPVPV